MVFIFIFTYSFFYISLFLNVLMFYIILPDVQGEESIIVLFKHYEGIGENVPYGEVTDTFSVEFKKI